MQMMCRRADNVQTMCRHTDNAQIIYQILRKDGNILKCAEECADDVQTCRRADNAQTCRQCADVQTCQILRKDGKFFDVNILMYMTCVK